SSQRARPVARDSPTALKYLGRPPPGDVRRSPRGSISLLRAGGSRPAGLNGVTSYFYIWKYELAPFISKLAGVTTERRLLRTAAGRRSDAGASAPQALKDALVLYTLCPPLSSSAGNDKLPAVSSEAIHDFFEFQVVGRVDQI